MRYSEEDLQKIKSEYVLVTAKHCELVHSFDRKFKSEKAEAYATHGFLRRINLLKNCILNIFDICPPEKPDKLSDEESSNLVINLQAFIINIFGSIDNLAWMWVYEQDIKDTNGKLLKHSDVGIYPGKKYAKVKESFGLNCAIYSEEMKKWFSHMVEYRHAVAHQIPLYVPSDINEEEASR